MKPPSDTVIQFGDQSITLSSISNIHRDLAGVPPYLSPDDQVRGIITKHDGTKVYAFVTPRFLTNLAEAVQGYRTRREEWDKSIGAKPTFGAIPLPNGSWLAAHAVARIIPEGGTIVIIPTHGPQEMLLNTAETRLMLNTKLGTALKEPGA